MLLKKLSLCILAGLACCICSVEAGTVFESDCVMVAPGEGPDNPWTVTTICGSGDDVSFTSTLGAGYSVHMAAADLGYG